MRLIFTCLLCMIFAITALGKESLNEDSLKIVNMINDWNRAWNIKDYSLASKWYSNDAMFTNAFGDKKNGRKEIEQLLKEVFSLSFVMLGESETVDQIFQALNKNIIVVHTAVTRKGQKMPDGTSIPDRKTTHLRVFQKTRNEWEIKSHLISDARDKGTVKH